MSKQSTKIAAAVNVLVISYLDNNVLAGPLLDVTELRDSVVELLKSELPADTLGGLTSVALETLASILINVQHVFMATGVTLFTADDTLAVRPPTRTLDVKVTFTMEDMGK